MVGAAAAQGFRRQGAGAGADAAGDVRQERGLWRTRRSGYQGPPFRRLKPSHLPRRCEPNRFRRCSISKNRWGCWRLGAGRRRVPLVLLLWSKQRRLSSSGARPSRTNLPCRPSRRPSVRLKLGVLPSTATQTPSRAFLKAFIVTQAGTAAGSDQAIKRPRRRLRKGPTLRPNVPPVRGRATVGHCREFGGARGRLRPFPNRNGHRDEAAHSLPLKAHYWSKRLCDPTLSVTALLWPRSAGIESDDALAEVVGFLEA